MITIPISADVRAALFHILRNDVNVAIWAANHDIDLGGARFREWEAFAPLLDLGVLIDVDPVTELVPGQSCQSKFYNVRFSLHVHYSGSASTLANAWLRVLGAALDDSSARVTGPSGQVVLVNDVRFLERSGGFRREEGFELRSHFRCRARYA